MLNVRPAEIGIALLAAGHEVKMSADLVEQAGFLCLDVCRSLDHSHKSEPRQLLTPAPIARLMASMLEAHEKEVRILDAGVGVGSLVAAAVAALCCRRNWPRAIQVTAYEIDRHLASYLSDTFRLCQQECQRDCGFQCFRTAGAAPARPWTSRPAYAGSARRSYSEPPHRHERWLGGSHVHRNDHLERAAGGTVSSAAAFRGMAIQGDAGLTGAVAAIGGDAERASHCGVLQSCRDNSRIPGVTGRTSDRRKVSVTCFAELPCIKWALQDLNLSSGPLICVVRMVLLCCNPLPALSFRPVRR